MLWHVRNQPGHSVRSHLAADLVATRILAQDHMARREEHMKTTRKPEPSSGLTLAKLKRAAKALDRHAVKGPYVMKLPLWWFTSFRLGLTRTIARPPSPASAEPLYRHEAHYCNVEAALTSFAPSPL